MKKIFLKTFFVLMLYGVIAPSMTEAHLHDHNVKLSDSHLLGDVLDKETHDHIPFATIQIKGTSIGTVTDASGHFFLKNVPIGEHTLSVSYVGYACAERKITVLPSQTQEFRFELEESPVQMEQVVVTSNRYATKKREAAPIVNVLSPELFSAVSACNIAEILPYQPGLRLEVDCQNCGYTQLRINGLEGAYSQILIDGRPLMSSLASVYGLEHLPAGMIDRVEVIRGGGSALFGSNAIGGVVNMITREAYRNSLTLENSTGVTEKGSYDINTTFNGSLVSEDSRAGVFLFGVLRKRSPYDRDGDGYSESAKLNGSTLGFRGYYKTSDYSKLTAEYHHGYEYRRGGDSIDIEPHRANIAEEIKHNTNAGSLKFDLFSKNNKHFASVYTSIQHIERNSYYGGEQDLNAYGKTNDFTSVSGLQYKLSWMQRSLLPADLSVGAEYQYNGMHDKMLSYNRELIQKTHLLGGYLQNEWKNKKVSVLTGFRLDKHNLILKPIFSPRVNLRYTPIDEIVMRLSYSSGYRAPQSFSEDLHITAVGGEMAVHENISGLRPEYSHSVSASFDLYKRWGDVHFNFLAEGFYTQLNDVFVSVPQNQTEEDKANNILRIMRYNASGGFVGGLNAELRVAYRKLIDFQVGYTYQNSRYFEPQAWGEDASSVDIRMMRTPDHYGYAVFTYNPFNGFSASINSKFTGKMYVPHLAGYIDAERLETTPVFCDTGVKIAYDIPLKVYSKLQINIGVKNIFDSYQRDFDKGPKRDSKYIYGPLLSRTYFLGLKFMM